MNQKIPSRTQDYSAWYNQVIKQADLVDASGSRGAMIIKPYGFALWEQIKERLDRAIKATGHENAYFPLLIPSAYLSREADHIEGFAKECAVVTHYRLRTSRDGKGIIPDPEARLEEPLVVRPTSETVIWDSFSRWIHSYRDLPLLLNQWGNVVRMEMRTRPFLRTREILWQEGHTAHATAAEAQEEARKMLQVYAKIIREELAVPLIEGIKTEYEKFAGAVTTYTMEALMQDGKALQLGTSHFLGQNFAKAFGVQFSDQAGKLQHVWGTSWGVTTRLIGALIMTHGDDRGLIIPPKIAPLQVVIVPIYKKGTESQKVLAYAQAIEKKLMAQQVRVKIDDRATHQPGWKFSQYECQGVPLRIALGPRDLEAKTFELTRRDHHKKMIIGLDALEQQVHDHLSDIQRALYDQALDHQRENIREVADWNMFKKVMKEKRGFIRAAWDGTTATEKAIKAETKATIRCIPSGKGVGLERCIFSGRDAPHQVLFAQAY